MRKKMMMLGAFALMFALVGCNDKKADAEAQASKISLSTEEKVLANGNANIGAQLLVRKAVLSEIKNAKLTDKEKFNLNFAKDDAAINYYVRNIIDKDIQIKDEDVDKIYEAHKAELKELPIKDAKAQIKIALAQQAEQQKSIEYYNKLVDKYNLNDILKKEFPPKEAEKKAEEKTK